MNRLIGTSVVILTVIFYVALAASPASAGVTPQCGSGPLLFVYCEEAIGNNRVGAGAGSYNSGDGVYQTGAGALVDTSKAGARAFLGDYEDWYTHWTGAGAEANAPFTSAEVAAGDENDDDWIGAVASSTISFISIRTEGAAEDEYLSVNINGPAPVGDRSVDVPFEIPPMPGS